VAFEGALSRPMKNPQQLHTLFAPSNLWMMRGRLMG
jgi:hypothetical protein